MSTHTQAHSPAGSAGDLRRPWTRTTATHVGLLLFVPALVWGGWMHAGGVDTVASVGLPPAAPGVVASLGRRPTHNRRYHAEVTSASPLAVGVSQSWTVHLTHRGHRRLANAKITVSARAPETGDVSPITPTARYIGHGDYRIAGIELSRSGWWNVALVIDAKAGVDSVAFNVVLPDDLAAARARPTAAGLVRQPGAGSLRTVGQDRGRPRPRS
jgi:hypothetical protein